MPILKNLPVRLKGGSRVNGELENTRGELILRKMSLNLKSSAFEEPSDNEKWAQANSLLDGGAPRDRNPFEDEEDENEANEERRGGKSSFKGTLDRIRGVSPLKTLGKLGKGLRMSGRSKGTATPSPQGSVASTPTSEKKKKGRRSSEGSLLRFAGKCRESLRKESLPNGELCSESEGGDSSSRRISFMKMVGLGKLKRESMADHSSHEEEVVEEEVAEEVKPREPLSGKDSPQWGAGLLRVSQYTLGSTLNDSNGGVL